VSRRKILNHFARVDPALAKAVKGLEPFPEFPLPQHRRISHFESLARAIVYQQLAGKAAATIWGRAVALTSGSRAPKPVEFLRFTDEELRGVGLSRNKMLAIQDLARRIESGELKLGSVSRWGNEQVLDKLVEVRGIGLWTAQMFLMFKLGRPDVFPSTDLGIQEGIRKLDCLEERPKPKEAAARASVWEPYRTAASWYLWRLADQTD